MSERDTALEHAARLVDAGLIPSPASECEEHVNDVLLMLAKEIRSLKAR
ncbi:hypothetical protein [Streptomyces sp. enrichment culture]